MSTLALDAPAALCGYPANTSMLLALSGGADSRLLLHLVSEISHRDGAPLRLCHVHHGIRGEEADRDEQFCRALAEHYGLPIDVLHADVPTIARESGETLEEAARRVRYDYFATLMRKHGIPMLLTAHHATDNLETVLFRLCRGTGLAGLGGIPPVRPFEAARTPLSPLAAVVVRPLLRLSREDILAACEKLDLTFVTDSTNADTAYARNRIRAEVLPALEALVDRPERQVTRLCASLREDEDCLHALAIDFLKANCQSGALSCAALVSAPPAIAKRVLRLWVKEQTGRLPEAVHVEALLALCDGTATARAVSVGGGYAVMAESALLRVGRDEREKASLPDYRIELREGEQDFPALGLRVCLAPIPPDGHVDFHDAVTANSKDATNVYNPFIRDTLTFDTIFAYTPDTVLFLRPRGVGDVLLNGGMHKRVRKLQNERGIPHAWRTRLPLLCDSEGVLWAPAIGLRDGLAAHRPTHRLTLTLYPISNQK